MSEQPIIHTERVDDVPLLLAQLQRMAIPALLDEHFPAHGNHQGLSLGWLATVWLAHILSRADHRLNQVRDWASRLTQTLTAHLPSPIRPTDFTDDRLADVLRILSQPAHWNDFEAALNLHTLRVYDLQPATVRLDSTSASGYWNVTDDGLFQFGHSKDHRPDLPQFKVMLATLDPLGMPLAADVVSGERSDDPLYLPIIARVRQSLGRTGLLYVGDCKLAALLNRATTHFHGDHYLCPLALAQLPKTELAALIERALSTPQQLVPIYAAHDDERHEPIAYASEQVVELEASVEEHSVVWSERRVLACSVAAQAAQGHALEQRLERAVEALSELLVVRRGKARPQTPEQAEEAIAFVLERHALSGLLKVELTTTAHTRTVRGYRGQASREVTSYTMTLRASRDQDAISEAKRRLGWRVYATNRASEQLSVEQAVWAYREEYVVERALGRLKGAPLSLRPLFLSRDEHVTGLVHLLTLGVRVLSVLEQAIRLKLMEEREPQALAGLYAGQASRTTMRPTSERVLEAFRNLTLTVVELPGQIIRHLTPLSHLQQRLLTLAGLDADAYSRLTVHSSQPPG